MSNISIPLIDCSSIANGDFKDISIQDFNAVAQQLGAAMTGIGMCNLVNHGLDKKKIEAIYNVSMKFFKLPSHTKLKYKQSSSLKSSHGYLGTGDQNFDANAPELRECWDISGIKRCDEKTYPMAEIPEFKHAFDDIRSDLENMAKKILRCIEIFMNLDEEFLISRHKCLGDSSKKGHTELRSLYYCALNQKENIPVNATRFGEHKDFGTITFVMQDEAGGLEVKTAEGEWIEALPVKDAILMNSGLLLEYWTGGHFHAAPHRVRIVPESIRTGIPRQSLVYFVDPDGDTEVYPLVPVLPKKEMEFQHYDKVINSFDYIQRLIEASTLKFD